ncbi:type II toxin-antitoxin system VapC family toxin [Microcystis aeruginosa]|uniref:Putative nucleic acid-binding protein, contains PIN domain protein n=1 Tax=Microcystis aeruginosa SPC777 TaxID=482300 RepID=S3IW52_MICAE|nr:putative nucleic acid-binding protein, contains PIN domain protein [Microcystis aeruginosa SPC777]
MIIVDTGFWVALFNNKDQYHLIAQQTLTQYSTQPLITTWCVLAESCQQLLQRSQNLYTGVEKLIQLMIVFERQPQKFLLFHLENTHLERIQDLMNQYQSLPMDLDDTSLVILAEELRNGRFFINMIIEILIPIAGKIKNPLLIFSQISS